MKIVSLQEAKKKQVLRKELKLEMLAGEIEELKHELEGTRALLFKLIKLVGHIEQPPS